MTEEQLQKLKKQQPKQLVLEDSGHNLLQNKRRRLLKGAVAIPVIMTLNSGAALAASSNLVGPVDMSHAVTSPRTITDTTTGEVVSGDIICVKKGTKSSTLPNGTVDVGDDAYAEVNKITKKDATDNDVPDLDEQAMQCLNNDGIMVSSGAWDSLGPNINSSL